MGTGTKDAEPTRATTSKSEKIRTLQDLADFAARQRTDGKTIAHCHGVFDLLHVGHIRHLREARGMADLLIVTITPDRHVNKGPGRPAFSESHRLEALAALEFVDGVAMNTSPQAIPAIEAVRPHLYVKGPDYANEADDITGGIAKERATVEALGGKLVTTEDVTFSSSNLINRYLPVYSDEVRNYLEGFRATHGLGDILALLDGARNLRVLVVGEIIIDEYQYCDVIGKSSKEPVLAARLTSQDRFAGGSIAVANHLSEFCSNVTLVATIGTEHRAFVDASFAPKVTPQLVETSQAPTIVKKRYVEAYLMQKLFETYTMDDNAMTAEEQGELDNLIRSLAPDHDIVIAVDYGHGMIAKTTVDALCETAPFLAVNTQLNAGNQGFNTASKYPRCDYLCISGGELSLEARNKRASAEQLIEDLVQRIECPRVTVTQGKYGCVTYHRGDGCSKTPALAPKVVDRIGAGDAVLAITSLCAQQGASNELLGFIGNVVGAEAVQIVGNREAISKVPLAKHIETLLK